MKDGTSSVVFNVPLKGIGILSFILLLFITLKTGVIESNVTEWSWLWVLSPLWIVPAIIGAMIVVVGIILGVGYLVCSLVDRYGK